MLSLQAENLGFECYIFTLFIAVMAISRGVLWYRKFSEPFFSMLGWYLGCHTSSCMAKGREGEVSAYESFWLYIYCLFLVSSLYFSFWGPITCSFPLSFLSQLPILLYLNHLIYILGHVYLLVKQKKTNLRNVTWVLEFSHLRMF